MRNERHLRLVKPKVAPIERPFIEKMPDHLLPRKIGDLALLKELILMSHDIRPEPRQMPVSTQVIDGIPVFNKA